MSAATMLEPSEGVFACGQDEQQGAEVKQPGMPPKDSFIAALWMKAVKGAGKRRTSPPPTGASERSLAYACSSASER